MKIPIESIVANPYRNIGKYPIDRAKVDALKVSIADTDFWDNLVVRKVDNTYELAYGHHRLVALQELGAASIDVPVRKLSDVAMLKMMAEENLNWTSSPAIVNETVRAAKKFLDDELAKCERLDRADKNISPLFTDEGNFQQCKQHGVGRDTILKFLGSNWKGWKIQQALEMSTAINNGMLDQKAVESLPRIEHANAFRAVVSSCHKRDIPLSSKEQRSAAKQINKELDDGDIGKRHIADRVYDITNRPPPRTTTPVVAKDVPSLKDFTKKTLSMMNTVTTNLIQIAKATDQLGGNDSLQLKTQTKTLKQSCEQLLRKL